MKKYITYTFLFTIMILVAIASTAYLVTINQYLLALLALTGAAIYTYVLDGYIKEAITVSNNKIKYPNLEFFN